VTCRTDSDMRKRSLETSCVSRLLTKSSILSALSVSPDAKTIASRFGLTPKGFGIMGSSLYSTRSTAS